MYARHSLYNECETQSRNIGLTHLTVASVYLELGGFRRCLEVSANKTRSPFLFNYSHFRLLFILSPPSTPRFIYTNFFFSQLSEKRGCKELIK